MKKNTKKVLLIAGIIIVLFVVNYSFIDDLLIKRIKEKDMVVQRIIDGDTIETSTETIRLLGINCPEKGEKGYEEAKEYLNKRLFNKTIRLEYNEEKKDKYGRTLAYVFLEDENINLELIEKGYANYYFPSGKDYYYNKFKSAWEKCIESNVNLCKKSENICQECIVLREFDYEEEVVLLRNICNIDCDLNGWIIKGEGRKISMLNSTLNSLENKEMSFEDFWASIGDTLFLRDDDGNLVLWKTY